ncbi:MAG: glutathione-regulated potassium-efflux system ancillary protein KefG [Enterobacteriaceae bacterium]|jgi:glutathione-regulated potassium-efflux system ancillary protein KefG|nr:glutathione-regulated potassium-efflux system ancillary protein KefG [Enterobacteriaceae bacterium]
MSQLSKVLILFAHPEPKRSVANKALLKVVRNLENVTVRDLYAYYPDFFINVHYEQQLLKEFDTIVFQFPIQTFACPALMKEWIDQVLSLRFAGSDGAKALAGKRLRLVVTAGFAEHSYQPNGMIGFALSDVLLPFRIMATTCHMQWVEPLMIYHARRLEDDVLQQYAVKYADWLSQPVDSAVAENQPAKEGEQ